MELWDFQGALRLEMSSTTPEVFPLKSYRAPKNKALSSNHPFLWGYVKLWGCRLLNGGFHFSEIYGAPHWWLINAHGGGGRLRVTYLSPGDYLSIDE